MRQYQVSYQNSAEDELDDLLAFFQEVSDSVDLALRIHDTVRASVDSLQTMPMRFASAGFTDKNIRKMRITRYPIVIYFEVVADTVIILHIAHARSNHQANFSQIYQ